MLNLLLVASVLAGAGEDSASVDRTLHVVVMDPLAAPLSCPCVEGYAQRDYEKLGVWLAKKLDRPVKVHFSDSLTKALKIRSEGKAGLIIGKKSVVEFDAARAKLAVTPVAALSDKQGSLTQTGLIVVPASDPATSVKDLTDYRIIFGPAESVEKHESALKLLDRHGIARPKEMETAAGCDEGARKILDAGPEHRGAAVISSYAAPLLEGCNTVPKGSLKLIGTTDPVPFIVAFTSEQLPKADAAAVTAALLDTKGDSDLLKAIESKQGFKPVSAQEKKSKVTAAQ
jgi:ABC-type phosphate/phosphonate transport system substrate-binding protein